MLIDKNDLVEMEKQMSNITKRPLFSAVKKKWLVGLVFSLVATVGYTQCKSYYLSDKGDTLNCVDYKGLKQGKWIVKEAALRGNPGYEEEGEFVNNQKEGIWRRFSEQGDVQSVESYRWGLLDGKSQYYSLQGLEREESWRAIDPSKKYDTLEVPDLYNLEKTNQVIVKNEGQSIKHGRWTWYDPSTGFTAKKEDYINDSAVNTLAAFGVKKGDPRDPSDTIGTAKKKVVPSVVQEWEKKNSGKKKVVIRDGSAGY